MKTVVTIQHRLFRLVAAAIVAIATTSSTEAGVGLADEGNKCGGKNAVGQTWPINVFGSQGNCKVKTLAILSGTGTLQSGPECGEVVDIPHISGRCGAFSKSSTLQE